MHHQDSTDLSANIDKMFPVVSWQRQWQEQKCEDNRHCFCLIKLDVPGLGKEDSLHFHNFPRDIKNLFVMQAERHGASFYVFFLANENINYENGQLRFASSS